MKRGPVEFVEFVWEELREIYLLRQFAREMRQFDDAISRGSMRAAYRSARYRLRNLRETFNART